LAFLTVDIAVDEPADDELDEFVAAAVRVAQDAVVAAMFDTVPWLTP
jgi:hypothetical protein